MKIRVKLFLAACLAATVSCGICLSGCGEAADSNVYMVSMEYTGSDGLQDIYTITYSDGTTSSFKVTNGEDGKDLTVTEIYEEYKQAVGDEDITFEEFLSEYFTVSDNSQAQAIYRNLYSVMKIYTEFVVSENYSMRPGMMGTVSDTTVYTGSAVIYDMDSSADGYTYIVTNYHVVYLDEANATYNGGSKIARKIYGYLYGSEGAPVAATDENTNTVLKDEDGYTLYDYGEYGIALEYVGGSVSSDIAVLRVKTQDILAINPEAQAVTLADDYHVGESAVAIGNPESQGISVTQGIVSVESDYISLDIDGTTRSYRSIRIDTALYSGNSGGGLFNAEGELIGITNAGYTENENMNYAVPIQIVRGVADNIIHYYESGDDGGCAYQITLGITVSTQNSKYVYDAEKGYGEVCEEVVVNSVEEGSVSEAMGVQSGDIIKKIVISGTEYEINRSFDISDLKLTMREGDTIEFVVERGGQLVNSQTYTLTAAQFAAID